MNNLYKHNSLFGEILMGKYTFVTLVGTVFIFYIIPWNLIYELHWYQLLIESQAVYFQNLSKIKEELSPDRIHFFISLQAFLNIVVWPIFIYSIYRLKPAQKISNGEMKLSSAFLLLFVGGIISLGSIYLFTSAGTEGGRFILILRKTDLGLTLVFICKVWGGILGWYLFLSVLIGLIQRIKSNK